MLSVHKKKTVERIRIYVYSSARTHKEILKEYLTSMVEKRWGTVDGKRLGKLSVTVYFCTLCFMKQGKYFQFKTSKDKTQDGRCHRSKEHLKHLIILIHIFSLFGRQK